MRKFSNLLLAVLVCCILPFQNIFALDVIISPNKAAVNLANNIGGEISPLSYLLEKPTLIVETLARPNPFAAWEVTSRSPNYFLYY